MRLGETLVFASWGVLLTFGLSMIGLLLKFLLCVCVFFCFGVF